MLGGLLRRIPGAPVAVVPMAFHRPLDVEDAFGFLVPRGQGLRILGTLYDSSIFCDRAPEGLDAYEALVRQDLFPLARRGVRILLGYYDFSTHPATNGYLIEAGFDRLCAEPNIECLAINEVIERDKARSKHLLVDGHWNPAGNRALAELLTPLF